MYVMYKLTNAPAINNTGTYLHKYMYTAVYLLFIVAMYVANYLINTVQYSRKNFERYNF